ncbi:hypothetical protein [Streptomyces sp. NPDC002209]|uniref:hypothetical protein n=1 Tax=Streptomyces sp. NPDC002209 TaxID=3364638 RepID=UPI0036BB1276
MQAMAGDHGRAIEAVRAALKPICDAEVRLELEAGPDARRALDLATVLSRLLSSPTLLCSRAGSSAASGRRELVEVQAGLEGHGALEGAPVGSSGS